MRVLVACECSGAVRDAFLALGHDAISCDLLPSETPGSHVQGDVTPMLGDPWDLVIAHPPCTFLSYAATKYWNRPGRAEKREAALSFFVACYNANAPRVCVENPVGYPNTVFRKPDQVIQPFHYGDRQRKQTCLWLRGLLPLWSRPTDELFGTRTHTDPPEPTYVDHKSGKKRYFTEAISGGGGGGKRSKTFPGIAAAMAQQWGAQVGDLCSGR
jgi:hypothetical protein